MAKVTITIDQETLQRARRRALEQGTSVDVLLRAYLEALAGARSAREAAVQELIEMSKRAASRRGGSRWSRDELHDQ